MTARRARPAAALLLAAVCGAAVSWRDDPEPMYLLTHAMCLPLDGPRDGPCQPQSIPRGAVVQIQLPGTPSRWSLAAAPRLFTGTLVPERVPSPGRVEGTSEVWIFTLRATTTGTDTLRFAENPRHLASSGVFRFPVTVQQPLPRRTEH